MYRFAHQQEESVFLRKIGLCLEIPLKTAKANGVGKSEMAEILTDIAFYAGWPNAWNAFSVAKEIFADEDAEANGATDGSAGGSADPSGHGGIFGLGKENVDYEEFFIGKSYLNPLTEPGKGIFAANITFEPGCRNNWHIHRAKERGGQMLICVDGEGWYVEEGKPARSLKPGDVVTIPPNVKHWHGAKKDSWFSHIALEVPGTETANEWLEPVTDEEYAEL